MKRARQNRRVRGAEVAPDVTIDKGLLREGCEKYSDWHWGIGAEKVIDWGDNDMPKMLIECGRLVRMHLRAPNEASDNPHPRRKRDTMIQLSQSASQNSHIAYDPDHPQERLYLLVDSQAMMTLKRRFWDDNNFRAMPLNDVAMIAGGKHGRRMDYPDIMVKPIGVLTAVVYYTNKKGDGQSYYIHKMAEISGWYPFLCADERGRLWIAGGSYTSPTPGITD